MKISTVRLAKDSVSDIRDLVSARPGPQEVSYKIRTRCKQFSESISAGDYAIVWLGSDNDKGLATSWKQGFRAIGQYDHIERGEGYQSETVFTLSVNYIFNESISRMEFLRDAPMGYYWCSEVPIIGVDDRANQTVRTVEQGVRKNVGALLYCLEQVQPGLREELLTVYPDFAPLVTYVPPNPRDGLSNEGIPWAETQKNSIPNELPRQLIYFGAPGTGKSYSLHQRALEYFSGPDPDGFEKIRRITFHPEYTYHQFVGSYRPVVTESGSVSYGFVAGPFADVLIAAFNNPNENYVLIIEELNRANPSAVFGEIFQLLDRGKGGVSEYPVNIATDFRQYLDSRLSSDGREGVEDATKRGNSSISAVSDQFSLDQIVIPQNVYIWATMNSADQGVYPLDTAFKRRWEFAFKGINDGSENCAWDAERRAINGLLLSECRAHEDKLIGPYFLADANRPIWGNKELLSSFKRSFEKVLMYLFEDAARLYVSKLFDERCVGANPTLADIYDAWEIYDFGIFVGLESSRVSLSED